MGNIVSFFEMTTPTCDVFSFTWYVYLSN